MTNLLKSQYYVIVHVIKLFFKRYLIVNIFLLKFCKKSIEGCFDRIFLIKKLSKFKENYKKRFD